MSDYASKTAKISKCGEYRYELTRVWDGSKELLPFVMLNPSTADAMEDDPTIRRCVGFAKREGFGGLVVVNLYGLRATDPKRLWQHQDPIGPDNDRQLSLVAVWAGMIVCAWGANPPQGRVDQVLTKLRGAGAQLYCLGKTKAGAPKHPLYIRGDQPLEKFP